MVSDQEIVNGVKSLLHQSNPNAVTSINGLVQQLEAKLGLDLSHKAGFIRDLLIGVGSGGGGVVVQARPQPPPSPPLSTQKDHFALQHYPHFHTTSHHHQSSSHQQFPPHFGFPLHHNHHPEELNFRYPPPHQQLYPYPHPHQQQQQQQHQHQQQLQQQQQHIRPNTSPHSRQHQAGRSEGSVVTRVAEAGLPEIKKEAGTPEIKKESAPAGTKRRGGPGGLNKVCGVSPELEAVVGEPALPRTQIVKQLWAYIRKHNLQDPSNKRKIICNDALRLVFETDCTDMFKMNKLLAKHIIPLDPTKEPGPDSKRLKVDTESTTESIEAGPKPEVTTDAASPTVPTIIISDALARFFDTEEREMTQSEAVRRVWEYVKVHELENELNPMMIMCDPKLQVLFGCENISAVEIAEMLMTHFFKHQS